MTTFLYQSLCCGYGLNCSCTGECSSGVQGVKRCSWAKPSNAIWSNVHDGKISLYYTCALSVINTSFLFILYLSTLYSPPLPFFLSHAYPSPSLSLFHLLFLPHPPFSLSPPASLCPPLPLFFPPSSFFPLYLSPLPNSLPPRLV